MTILLIASEKDSHALALSAVLKKQGQAHVFFNWQNLEHNGNFSWYIDKSGWQCHFYGDGKKIDFENINAVWWRNLTISATKAMPEKWISDMAANESYKALSSLWQMMPCLWVNKPDAQRKASLKVHQLDAARQIGFSIPDTLVTNEAAKVQEFYEKHKGQIINKLIDGQSWRLMPEFELPRKIPTSLVEKEDLPHLEQVGSCLHLFQEKIEKQCDYRLTVVGEEIFACRIDSQSKQPLIDWRLDREPRFSTVQIEPALKTKCLQLMQTLDLKYGAIDLCLNKDNEPVFLEINGDGQFLFVQEKLGLPILESLAQLLLLPQA